ncbi:hypothetical protein [Metasolibacillus meyeri]|uniref:hypothetical protein n=1 Tax=Metasolibacillus meyeri TaxID=1071052 RepID=UPI000D301B23|nr:hypothetical protein [Metasolibacillus meyeri]
MAKLSKKERMLRAYSEAVNGRFSNETQSAMNEMLWILSEGTRYELEVKEAFDHLEELDGIAKKEV